ncbi:hypothetical protein J1614_002410 [Plenodomus biglobosus]|nr:hypothetical protein J1614_002410 [Plenodomus biglobosus]
MIPVNINLQDPALYLTSSTPYFLYLYLNDRRYIFNTMLDLLSSLIFTPLDAHAVTARDQMPTAPVPCTTTTPEPRWKDQYGPSRDGSPLRHEYVVPGAWPNETLFESAGGHKAGSTRDDLVGQTAAEEPADVPTSSSPIAASDDGADEAEDAKEYDTEYVAYLVGTAISEAERRQRREDEELQRVRYADDKLWDREDDTREWLFEEMLCADVKRACRGQDRTLRISTVMERKRRGGWARDERVGGMLEMGKGTPGHKGHEKMQEFFLETAKKRKREVAEEVGDEAEAEAEARMRKKPRKMASGTLKSRLARGNESG